MEKPKPWYRRRPALIGWASVGLIILAVLGLGQLQQHLTERKIEAKLAAIRAQGLPTTLAEVNEYYTAVPDADNGALVLLSSLQHMVEAGIADPWVGEMSTNSILTVTNPITPQAKSALSSLLASNQIALQRIHQSTTKSAWRYPADLNKWPNVPLEHLAPLRATVRLLQLEALHHLTESRPSDSIKSTETALHIADSLAGDPFLISFLVRNALVSIIAKNTAHLLQRSEFSPGDLAHLQEALVLSESKTSLLKALYGERALIAGAWYHPVNLFRGGGHFAPVTPFDHSPASVQYAGWTLYERGGFKTADLLNFLRYFDELESAAKQPTAMALQQAKDLSTRFGIAARPAMDMILTAHSGSILTHGIPRHAFMIATLRTTQAALAVERYRMDNGQLPKHLGDLVPAYLKQVPMDPFNSNPLLYHGAGNEFRVYSVGENGQDDGGEDSPRPTNDDIAFRLEREPAVKP